MAAMSVAERQKETRSIAPNCRHPRFVFKSTQCTRTPHGNVCFHTVKNYDALIEAFQPRMLVDAQVRAAPVGTYCWILRKREGVPHVYAMKVICEQEIGSLHNFIFLLSSNPGRLLKEDDTFIDAKEVIAAGELEVKRVKVKGENVEREKRDFNLQSGSFMEPIFRMTGWQPINRRRIPKTREMLEEEIAQKTIERKILTDQVGPFLFAEFDSMKPPTLVGPLTRTNIVEHVKSISESLGGRPFIKGAHIMVSENNMGLLDSLLSTDLPEWKRPLHVSTFKNAKTPYAKHATQAKQSYAKHATQAKHAKNPYAKKGGARRTRKARRARRV